MICPTTNEACVFAEKGVELILARNTLRHEDDQVSETEAQTRVGEKCIKIATELAIVWPAEVKSTGCLVVDAGIFEVS